MLLASTGFLGYMFFQQEIPKWFFLRLLIFLAQHVFTLTMMIYRKFDENYEDPIQYLIWLVAITGVNFITFAGTEIYALIGLK